MVRADVQAHLLGLLRKHQEAVFTAAGIAEGTVVQALEQDEEALQVRSRNSVDETSILRDQAELVERGCAVIVRLVNECLQQVRHSKIFWFLLTSASEIR